ncbi:hypothetical protein FLA4_11820 [Candidatus Rickettsia kotlanii]|nr:hypothetical protein FLA4_11820 [Candidatus Rickettsia kotlanii]BDU62014.1 hypothetical protein HM2_11820 [Candidatus Rickettsia kotlanii]
MYSFLPATPKKASLSCGNKNNSKCFFISSPKTGIFVVIIIICSGFSLLSLTIVAVLLVIFKYEDRLGINTFSL